MHHRSAILLLMICACSSLFGQGSAPHTFTAKVIDRSNDEPIWLATSRIEGTDLTATTDTAGVFTMVLPDTLLNKARYMTIVYVGYQTLRKRIGKADLHRSRTFKLDPGKWGTDPPVIRWGTR